jgi:quercetin dioxygenase-like cupin family protein
MDLGHRDDTIAIQHVTFLPGARTYWHHHESGQLLRVVAGAGWLCEKGGKPQRIGIGDVVWCPAGTVHWHGADEGSYMCHMAVSHGKTSWMHEVSAEEWAAREQ